MSKFGKYPAVVTPEDTDLFVVKQGAVTKRVAMSVLKSAGGFAPFCKNNLAGTTVPGAGDDSADGYSAGSLWLNLASSPKEAYQCMDATVGNAVWINTTLDISELGTMAVQDSTAVAVTGGAISGANVTGTTGAQNKHGFVNRTDSTLVWTNTSPDRTLTITGTFVYYYQGTKITVSGSPAAQITNTPGLWFIYFNSAGVLTAAQGSVPSFETTVIVCTIWWNGTAGIVQDERHSYNRDRDWHLNAHLTIGARYENDGGLALVASGTGAAASFSTTAGYIWDEDIRFRVVASSSFTEVNKGRIWYQTGATTYTFVTAPSAIPFYWLSNKVKYVNAAGPYALADVDSNRYVNVWVYGTTDINQPVYFLLETIATATTGYNSASTARNVAPPNLVGLGLAPEMKLLYRIVVKGDGAVQTAVAADDYRLTSSLPAGGLTVPAASGVSFAPAGTIGATNVQAAIEEMSAEAVQKSGDTMTGALGGTAFNWAKAADVASATPNIGAAAGNYVEITGTTTITAFDSVAAGITRFVRFMGALTLTHNAVSLILPGGVNRITEAGDRATLVSLGSGNWLCQSFLATNSVASNAEALAGVNAIKVITPTTMKYVLNRYQPRENLIGIPGEIGFGVGICPLANLPPGMTPMAGYDQLGHDNYGNYRFTDGSVMIWVPRFFYRIGHASNPTYATYGVNSNDIKGVDTYATTVAANADGYALHRSFIDGGAEKLGFFRDKYKCSKVANGAGYTAASIKNGLPLSSAAAHNPFSGLTDGADFYYSALDLAHRRDGVDGNVNASSIFFCSSQFMRGAIAMLSMAHGQAATSTTNCAWYHATYNYPKGCNNNALRDCDDTTVIWETDGYSNCGKTGSAGYGGGAGNVFAKSTHNGQNCGSADDNGLMYEISIGVTCDGTNFYVAKQATAMKTFTNGDNAAATDHWGRYDMFDALTVPFITGNDGWTYFGNGANQVLADDVSGNAWLLAGLGFPETANGLGSPGTNLFGKDGLYRYLINKLCLIVARGWADGSSAGVWHVHFYYARGGSSYDVGFRAACYHV